MSESPRVYIGLYKTVPHRSQAGVWHWSLIVQPTADTPLSYTLDSWSIAEDDDGTWKERHRRTRNNDGVVLYRSGNFFALVALPQITVSRAELNTLLEGQVAEQGATPLVVGRGEWSCAQWVIRVLQEIRAKGWFVTEPAGNLADRTAYYDFIRRSKGAMCELALQNNMTSADYVGTVVNGVRVL